METILAIAFGRVIDLQRGESDQLTEAARAMFRGGEEGKSTSLAPILLILSKPFLYGRACTNSTHTHTHTHTQVTFRG